MVRRTRRIKMRKMLSLLLIAIAISIATYAGTAAWRVRAENIAQYNRIHVMDELLSSETLGLVILGVDGRIIEWNPGAVKIFGWEAHEVMGSEINFLMPPAVYKLHCSAMARLDVDPPRHKEMISVEAWGYTKAGDWIPVHVVVTGFHDTIGYYHIALISKAGDYRRMPLMAKPAKDAEVPPLPEPGPVPNLPGIYHPFQDNG